MVFYQMELEHRSPKSRYARTNRKDFEKQLGGIERRQARIRRIRQKLAYSTRSTFAHEKGPESSACSYHIGKSQNYPLDLGILARDNCNDPAVRVRIMIFSCLESLLILILFQNFTDKLKIHLLPRIQERLHITPKTLDSDISTVAHQVLIKGNRVYNHKLARFYYTTYDIRRSEDTINPKTPHRNIMLLADHKQNDKGSDPLARGSAHPFLYGRVIGIYHVNIVYTGPGAKGYDAMRFDFLYVRWFQFNLPGKLRGQDESGWASLRLDCLSFPPMAERDSLGFIDPNLVLRSCHLIPAYSLGKARSDGIGISKILQDSKDWKYYYVNRLVAFSPLDFCFTIKITSGLLTAI